jgi:hypothetical protein
MPATNIHKPRTEAYTRLIERISEYTGTGHGCTLRAVEAIAMRHPDQTPEQIGTWLLVLLRTEQMRREMMALLAECLQEQMVEVQV